MLKSKISRFPSSRIKIGVDIDNVICDTFRPILKKFNKTFNKKIRYQDVYDFFYLEKQAGVEKDRVRFLIDTMILKENNITTFLIYDEAQRVIQSWRKNNYQVHYISARPLEARQTTIDYLKHYNLIFSETTVNLMDYDCYDSDVDFKKKVVADLEIDFLVEDSREIAEAVPTLVFLLDRPWNKGRLKPHIKRVYSWPQIKRYVGKLIKTKTDEDG